MININKGRNDFYCPSNGNCYRNQTVLNPNNFEIPCPNAIHMNQTDSCMELPEYNSDVCDDIFYYGSNRTRL